MENIEGLTYEELLEEYNKLVSEYNILKMRLQETYKISVCCFPKTKEIEFTISQGEFEFFFTVPNVDESIMDDIANIIGPCVYHDAEKRD